MFFFLRGYANGAKVSRVDGARRAGPTKGQAMSTDSYYQTIKHDPSKRNPYNLGAAVATAEALARTLNRISAYIDATDLEGLQSMKVVIALDLAQLKALIQQVNDR